MKTLITLTILLAFTAFELHRPAAAEAGNADTAVVLVLIAGAAVGGYFFAQHYSVKVNKKGALLEGDEEDSRRLALAALPSSEESGRGDRLDLTLVRISF